MGEGTGGTTDLENQTWYGPEIFTSNSPWKLTDKNSVIFVSRDFFVFYRLEKTTQTFNNLGFSNGIDLKLRPVVGLDKRR